MDPWRYLALAASCATVGSEDRRKFCLGAVGVRSDGAVVKARNGSTRERCPAGHAETRLSRKLDVGSTVFVARILRSGGLALAAPCVTCRRALRSRGVRHVYYTVDSATFGRMVLE